MKALALQDLGYNSFFEENRQKLGLASFDVARVISEHKGAYRVKTTQGEFLAKITGKQMFRASSREDYPAVGDWVTITKPDNELAIIHTILPRHTILKRKHGDRNRAGEKNQTQVIATNIDAAFVVESVNRDYNLNRFERYFSLAQDGGVQPVVVLNKIDLISQEELDTLITQLHHRFPDVNVILTSTLNNEGLEELKQFIAPGKTYCFLGSSGVGKSSLINKLLGEEAIKTGGISEYSDRGKHVTTVRQMYFLKTGSDATARAGGIVIDNPGIREVGLTDAGRGVEDFFGHIAALGKQCKYVDCTHAHEPGCAVRAAVDAGELDAEQYANYVSLKKETTYYEMSDIEKRNKDKQFGKFIKKAKKDLKDLGNKF